MASITHPPLPELRPGLVRHFEDLSGSKTQSQVVFSYGGQTHGGYAAALRAVWIASQLAGSDLRLQIDGDDRGGLREDALLRRRWRMREFLHLRVKHLQLRVDFSQPLQFHDRLHALRWRKNLGGYFSALGSEHAHPDLSHLFSRGPKLKKVFQVIGTIHHLSRDGAVHGDPVSSDVLENAFVGGRFAASIVLRLQAVNRDDDPNALHTCPLQRDRAKGAGDDLHEDAALLQIRQQRVKFPKSH